MTADGGRFARWSQRKAAARRGGALPAEPVDTPVPIRPDDDGQPLASERQNAAVAVPDTWKNAEATSPTNEDMPVLPPVEDLTFQSDFTAFMGKNVPEAIKRAALRKLWGSDPVLANLDGLNDYCEDFNVIDTPITVAQTSYQVGKGYFDEVEEKLAKLDDAPSGRIGEGSAGASKSDATPISGSESRITLGDNDAAAEEDPAAMRQVAAVTPGDETPEPDEDNPK